MEPQEQVVQGMYRIKTGLAGNRDRCSGLRHVMDTIPFFVGPGIGSERGVNPDTVECCAVFKSTQMIDGQRKRSAKGSVLYLVEVAGIHGSIRQPCRGYF